MVIGTNQDFEAEHDAHTLASAEQIKNDSKRLGKAKKAASKMVKEKEQGVKALKKVAGKKSKKSNQIVIGAPLDEPNIPLHDHSCAHRLVPCRATKPERVFPSSRKFR